MAKQETGQNNSELKQLGWRIPEEAKDAFTAFCDSVNAGYEEACAGALILWTHLPAQVREWATLEAKGQKMIDPQFWKDCAAGLELGLRAQLENQRKNQE